jgi:peptidoglycan/xylan/chitin deacetylase (PgdA/CDA1 family)
VYWRVFPALSAGRRQRFLKMLAAAAGIDESHLAAEAGLYLTRKNVRELAGAGFEIGSHTYSHVHCRTMVGGDFGEEIDRNREELEQLTGTPVQSFSVPYGSSMDLTNEVAAHLRATGHDAIFLSESVANRAGADPKRVAMDRISIHANRADGLFCEIEVLPRLRAMRNRYARAARG